MKNIKAIYFKVNHLLLILFLIRDCLIRIDEKTLEKCFVEVYNMLLDNNKEIIDSLTSTIEKIVLEEFDNSLIDNKNKEINLIEKKISSLLDLGLETKIENKMNELTKVN